LLLDLAPELFPVALNPIPVHDVLLVVVGGMCRQRAHFPLVPAHAFGRLRQKNVEAPSVKTDDASIRAGYEGGGCVAGCLKNQIAAGLFQENQE
jgi:hypothetical protein